MSLGGLGGCGEEWVSRCWGEVWELRWLFGGGFVAGFVVGIGEFRASRLSGWFSLRSVLGGFTLTSARIMLG